jgi:SAM-dependent methyltransferase
MRTIMKKDIQINKLSDVKVRYITDNLSGSHVLDLGAGYAYYSEWLATTTPNLTIVAIDQLELPGSKGFQFIQANLEAAIPCDDQSFNTILAFDIIEHINQEHALVKELYRICKPGGIIIGSVPHDDDKFLPRYNLTFYHRSDITHKRYYTPETLAQTLKNAGFIDIEINLEGGISPQVFAEFFSPKLRFIVKKMIGLLRRTHIINDGNLSSDLFFVARKINS